MQVFSLLVQIRTSELIFFLKCITKHMLKWVESHMGKDRINI